MASDERGPPGPAPRAARGVNPGRYPVFNMDPPTATVMRRALLDPAPTDRIPLVIRHFDMLATMRIERAGGGRPVPANA